jgi:hypothetical protein
MSLSERIRSYFLPLTFSAREQRSQNRTVAEANKAAAAALVQAERDYWSAYYKRATTQEERWQAAEELERLDALERAS